MEITRHVFLCSNGEVLKANSLGYICDTYLKRLFNIERPPVSSKTPITVHLTQKYHRHSVLVELTNMDTFASFACLNGSKRRIQLYDALGMDICRFPNEWCYVGIWYGHV